MTKKKKAEENGTQFQHANEQLFAFAKINNKVRIVVGRNIISEKEFDKFKEAQKYLDQKPWEIIVNLICLISKDIKNNETTKETKESEESI